MSRPIRDGLPIAAPGRIAGSETTDARSDGTIVERVGDLMVIRESAAPRAPAPGDRSATQTYRRVGVALALSDAACIVIALLASHRLWTPATTSGGEFVAVLLVAPVIWVVVFNAFALYGLHHLAASEAFRRVISATFVGVALVTIATVWWDAPLSRAWMAGTWAMSLVLELGARRVWHWTIRSLQRRGRLGLRTLVVGTNEEAHGLTRTLAGPARGFVPVGYVGTDETAKPHEDGLPVVSDLDGILHAIRTNEIECVFVASTAVSPDEMFRVVRACRQANVEMRISANLPDILTSRLAIQQIDRVMSFSLRPVRLTGSQAALKRGFDLLFGSLALLLALPVMAIIGAAILASDGRPVLFRQKRVTRNGGLFTMYKFRTMVPDADSERFADLTQPFFKLRDDPRVTRIGRLLRPYSLDELPQFWNVVRGEMSLVGPRALRVEQIAADPQLLTPRHDVKAGMTGWWQIHGRNDVDYPEAVRMDLFYIENWSLTLDLYILLKTLGIILSRKGAY